MQSLEAAQPNGHGHAENQAHGHQDDERHDEPHCERKLDQPAKQRL